jgi:hypothetical protein
VGNVVEFLDLALIQNIALAFDTAAQSAQSKTVHVSNLSDNTFVLLVLAKLSMSCVFVILDRNLIYDALIGHT